MAVPDMWNNRGKLFERHSLLQHIYFTDENPEDSVKETKRELDFTSRNKH